MSTYASNNYQSLHLKLEPASDGQQVPQQQQWSPEMQQVVECFFDTRVAVPPFRPNAVTAFLRILQCPGEPLKDLVNLMRYDVVPDLVQKTNVKWAVKICLTVLSPAMQIMPPGQPGLLTLKDKMLLFLRF